MHCTMHKASKLHCAVQIIVIMKKQINDRIQVVFCFTFCYYFLFFATAVVVVDVFAADIIVVVFVKICIVQLVLLCRIVDICPVIT